MIILTKLAGIALIMVCIANGFAFKKLGWHRNLEKTEVFFQQIFKVHTLYIVMTMGAMATALLFTTDELINADHIITRGFLWFGALFWGGRVILHIFYYHQKIKAENPLWNALFLSTFIYISAIFTTLALT